MSSAKSAVNRVVERIADLLIAWRKGLLALFVLLTLALGYSATHTQLDPGFNKQIPVRNEFMVNFLNFSQYFTGANRFLVSVKWKGEGDIYNREYLDTLNKVTGDVFFINGVSRASVTSLFTANVRYIEITEEGFFGDVVVPPRFTGSTEDLAQVRSNIARSGQIGRLVSNDLKSSMVRADLQDLDPQTGKPVSYAEVAKRLEDIRAKYSNDDIEINIVGFAKLVGDVIEGLTTVISFFVIAFVITGLMLWLYSRSWRLAPDAGGVGRGFVAGGLAAGPASFAGAGDRPDVDSGAVSDFLHWRVPRSADDQCLEAGRAGRLFLGSGRP